MAESIETQNGEQANLRILKELRKIITEDYKDGGRFPSSRTMVERLNANRITYNKAMDALFSEHSAINLKQRGVYIVPEQFRMKKIGIVMPNNTDSPFLVCSEVFCPFLTSLEQAGISGQIIQGAKAENILNKALIHNVKAIFLLGFLDTSELKLALEIQKNATIPVIVYNSDSPSTIADAYDKLIYFEDNNSDLFKNRANFFITRKHKKVLFLGKYLSAKLYYFAQMLEENNIPFDRDYCLENEDEIKTRLPEILRTQKISGIISEGSFQKQHILLNILNNTPKANCPTDVILRHNPQISKHIHTLSRLNFNVYEETITSHMGETIAQACIDYIENNTPITSTIVPIKHTIEKF